MPMPRPRNGIWFPDCGGDPEYNLVGASIHIRWFEGLLFEMRGIEMYRLHNDLIAESWHATERAQP